MKVFVTGGNGFIGSRVVSRLHELEHEVRCLLRESSRTDRIDEIPFESHIGDVRNVDTLIAGMEGCDAVIHLASISSWEHIRSPLMREVTIGGTGNVLEAAKRAGGLKTVFVSTVAAINGTDEAVMLDEKSDFTLNPAVFLYAGAKHEAEALCLRYAEGGLDVVIVNPCEVYGPQDDDLITASYLLDTLKDWPAMAVTGGTAVAHVDDIAAGIVAAMDKGRSGQRYILGGENLTIREVIDKTLAAGAQKKWVLQLPNGLVKGVVKTLARLRLPTPILPDLLDYACLYWFVDSGKAEEELGYSYRSADDTIQSVVDWLHESGRVKRRRR